MEVLLQQPKQQTTATIEQEEEAPASPLAQAQAPPTPRFPSPSMTASTAVRLLLDDANTGEEDGAVRSGVEALAHLAHHFWQLVGEAAALREEAVATAVAKTRAELMMQLSVSEGVEGMDMEMDAEADARLARVWGEVEGLEGRQAAFRRLLQAAELRLEELQERERAGVLALQSPPEPGAGAAATTTTGGEVVATAKQQPRNPYVMRLLLVCLALGLTEPAVHLLFVVARELPGWWGAERVVVM